MSESKYIVEMRVKTRAAVVVRASGPEEAGEIAGNLAKANVPMDTLDSFMDPSDLIEFDWTSDVWEASLAADYGYENARAIND